MSTITIGLANIKVDKRIRVFSSYDPVLKDALKSIPGARWDGKDKNWNYPCSPQLAPKIVEVLKQNNYNCTWDEKFDGLLELALAHERAQKKKEAHPGRLEQPKIRKTDGWLHQLRAYNYVMAMWGEI